MTVADEYRSYAQECLRWADETDNEEHRSAFLEMAKVWTHFALHGNGPQPISEAAEIPPNAATARWSLRGP
jgi:hypothetical protein